MGWFGFNGGSSLGANGLAVNAVVTTNTSAAAAGLVWDASQLAGEQTERFGDCNRAVVGLVAVTPASGFVTPAAALVIGATAAPISYYSIKLRQRWNLDESLDVWACHGMGGAWGAVATGIFASKAVNPAGADGLLYGNPGQLLTQIAAVAITVVFALRQHSCSPNCLRV
jgi:ammonium transporter, Amt family